MVVRICSSPEEVQDVCVTTTRASSVELISKVGTMGREEQIMMVPFKMVAAIHVHV